MFPSISANPNRFAEFVGPGIGQEHLLAVKNNNATWLGRRIGYTYRV